MGLRFYESSRTRTTDGGVQISRLWRGPVRLLGGSGSETSRAASGLHACSRSIPRTDGIDSIMGSASPPRAVSLLELMSTPFGFLISQIMGDLAGNQLKESVER
jgi:hypothetical protein